MKDTEILNLVEFDVDFNPSIISYTQAIYVAIHKVVYDPSMGSDSNTPQNSFINEAHIDETRLHIPTAMATGIEAFYVVLSHEQSLKGGNLW